MASKPDKPFPDNNVAVDGGDSWCRDDDDDDDDDDNGVVVERS